jgi:hypothetical protein
VKSPEHRSWDDGYQVGHRVAHHGLDPTDAWDDPSHQRALDLGFEREWLEGYWDGREEPEDDA